MRQDSTKVTLEDQVGSFIIIRFRLVPKSTTLEWMT